MGITLNLNQATHDGFLQLKDSACGEAPVAAAGPGPLEVISCSSTTNQVGEISWSWGHAGGKTESSSSGKLA